MLKRVWVLLLFILLAGFIVLHPKATSAQSACTSLSGCTRVGSEPVTFPNLGCSGTRTTYNCSGTTCYQDSATCTTQQAVCNNPPSTGDNYNCVQFCTDLKNTPGNCCPDGTAVSQCGNPPAEHCTDYYNVCVNSYCVAAGDGIAHSSSSNYSCPSPQQCISPPDARAHQCVTPVVNPPTVTLTVNNVPALTLNKGDTYILSWSTANSPTNCTAFGSWSWNLNSPPNNLSSGTTTDSKQASGTYIYSLTCSNSAGSDTKSVAVNVNKTCPDYTADGIAACVSQNTCGWKVNNAGTGYCISGTVCGGPSDNSGVCPTWYWTDAITNQCVACQTPPSAPPATSCTGSPTCSISASATSSTSGRATISTTGGCSTGYDRVEWFLGPSGGTLQSQGSNFGPSADFSNLTTNTTYGVSASWWSISDSTKPSVTCQPPASFTPTSSTATPLPSTTTTPTANLKCRTCNSSSPDRWYWNADCGLFGPLNQNCSSTCGERTNPNNYPAVEDGYCWLPAAASPPGPQEINGEIWIRETNQPETKASLSFYQSADDGKIWFWFSHFPRYEGDPVPFSGHCAFKGFLNTYVNCFQENRVDANRAYIGSSDANVGNKSNSADIPQDHLKLIQWPPGYNPVGYYLYQEVQTINPRTERYNCTYTCTDTTTCDNTRTETRYHCNNNCNTSGGTCRNEDCSEACQTREVNDGHECRTKPKEVKALGALTQGILNQIDSYCDPTNGNARIDLVFEKLPLLSGLVCKDNDGDGSCTTGTGALRTCTDEVYPSGTVTATKSITGPAFSREVTPGGGYSMPIPAGEYNVGFSAPNVTLTSPALPLLISITADYTQDFCVNPLSAWLKTTGGDVHSNTGINTPGGP